MVRSGSLVDVAQKKSFCSKSDTSAGRSGGGSDGQTPCDIFYSSSLLCTYLMSYVPTLYSFTLTKVDTLL